jgi:hypothetical protein
VLRGGARRVGLEAFFVEEEDAGAEGEEHDGEASVRRHSKKLVGADEVDPCKCRVCG